MKLIIQNIATEYQDEGAGPVLLFLHGWKDNLHTFDGITPLLSIRYRVIRIDLPGFGESETPPTAWGLDEYIKFVKEFIFKLNIQIYAMVGHSFGGRIILKSQIHNLFLVKKIILIGAAGVTKRNTLRNSCYKAIAKVGGLITFIPPLIFWREKLRKRMYSHVGSDYLGVGDLKQIYLKVIEEDLAPMVHTITKPTLLIWGSNDTQTPLVDGQLLAKLIPNSILEIITGASHFIHREKPEQVAQLMRKFLL